MRKAATGLAILLLLALGALVLLPQFIDLNRFKGPLAAELAALTGRSIEIGGPLKLSLLPGPRVTVRDLRLANPPGTAAKDMLRLRAVEVKLGFWPLLSGAIEIRRATLIEPDVDIERLPDGKVNWQSDARPGASDASPAPGGTLALAIDRLAIQDGAVTYRSGATVERFEHINASVTLVSPSGPFDIVGELVTRGAAVGFEARSGKVDAAAIPVQATVTIRPAAQIRLDAMLTGPSGDRRIDGKLKIDGGNFQTLAAMLARAPMPTALAQPFALAGDVAGSSRALSLEHLAVDVGSAHGEGGLHVTPGTPLALDLRLSVGRLDLDRWLARKAALAPSLPTSFGSAWAAMPDAAAPVPLPSAQPDGGLALPQGFNARIDFAAEAVLWRNGVLRQGRLQATLAEGRLTLDRAAALLPGGSQVVVSGSATTPPEGLRAQGAVQADADDLRSVLAWLGVTAAAVPADRLRKASLSGRFTLAGDRLDLGGIDATVDATRLSGAATVILRERPGIGLRLVADRFNLDAYLPAATAGPTSSAAPPAAANPLIDALDANLDARVQALTWRGQPLGDVHLAGTLQNSDATIHELSIGDLGGAAARLSGALRGLAGGMPKGQLAFDASGPEFDRVLRVAWPGLATGRSYGDFRLDGGVSLDGEKLSVTGDLEILQGRLHVSGDASASGASALDVAVEHPSFAALMRDFSPGYQPAGGDPGAFRLAGRVTGAASHFAVDRLTLAIGESTLEGRLDVALGGVRPQLTADVKIGDWTIDRLLGVRQAAALGPTHHHAALLPGVVLAQARAAAADRWSRQPIDLAFLTLADIELGLSGRSLAYGGWRIDQPALTATLKDGALAVKQLTGSALGGGIEVSGSLESAATPAFRTRLTLKDADLKQALANAAGVAIVEGRFDVDAEIASNGRSAADIVSRLAGDAKLHAHDGAISGIDLAAVNVRLSAPDRPSDLLGLIRSGAGGQTAFSALQGNFHLADGIARSDDIRLMAEGGEGRAVASFNLPQWTLASRIELRLTGAQDAPPLVLRLDGPIDEPREVFEVNALEQFLDKGRQR